MNIIIENYCLFDCLFFASHKATTIREILYVCSIIIKLHENLCKKLNTIFVNFYL